MRTASLRFTLSPGVTMLIRTYADIEKLEGEDKLSAGEKLLVENCKLGELTTLGDGPRPERPSPARTIRADLLRYLILGGCDGCRVHERGVQLRGAWIKGELDLSFAQAKGAVRLIQCAFESPIAARQARFDALTLNGSKLPALDADGSMIKGSVFLHGLESKGKVSFAGTEIGGQLSCQDAQLSGGTGDALNVQGASIKDGVFLDRLKSTGTVSVVGAEIGGPLSCEDAELNGVMGYALNGQRVIVRNGLFWRKVKSVVGTVGLNAAHLKDLVDDEQSWDLVSDLSLVGVTYDNVVGPLDLHFRKSWLKKGARFKGQFHPQPYQQLAKFYRETGHRHEAREVLVEKEVQHRRAVRAAIREGRDLGETRLNPRIRIAINWLWDGLMRLGAGYGYKPWRSLFWLGGMVTIVAVLANLTWNAGDFAPSSAVILTSPEWKIIADSPSENPADAWTARHAAGKDYETFYSFAYALDVVVPVLDLGQTDAWAPSPARGDWGSWLFYAQKMFIVLGWVVTAIAAAAISGMIRRDD